MDLERERRLYELLQRVLADGPESREAFIAGLPGLEAADRARLIAMARRAEEESQDSTGKRRDASVPPTSGDGPRNGDSAGGSGGSERPGSCIGPYKLLEEIGEGGFGVVFLAEQETPVRRRVALKVIKPGMDTRQVVARFEQERQALALMDHPSIARVFDAGATASGRPYFVMELVRGDPITTYCDREKLTTAERLRLFAEVCRAVQHAHQKGVIHRDLKPGNVLVTIVDGKPVPKVIDFGVAKATQGPLTDRTLFTAHRQIIGTPLYMSPEQAQLSGVDVDTRSDVYSLGVLLYELLVGVPPFAQEQLMQAGIAEMYRMIRELEPQKPSTRVATLGPSSTAVAAQRRVEVRRLGALLRGDLDWIVMRCLEKERARRYDSASDLAQDIERHMGGEAVEAAPPSALYRMRKLVRRKRTSFAAAAAVMIVALAGVAAWLRSESNAFDKQKVLTDNAERSTTAAEESLYVAALFGIQDALSAGEGGNVRRLLDSAPERLRHWEWSYLDAVSDTSAFSLPGYCAAFSPDSKRIATAAMSDHTIRVWDVNSGGEVLPGKSYPDIVTVTALAFSPDGRRVVSLLDLFEAQYETGQYGEHWACLWDATASEPITDAFAAGDGDMDFVFTRDGTRIVEASLFSPYRVFDSVSGAVLDEFGNELGNAVEQIGYAGCLGNISPDGSKALGDADLKYGESSNVCLQLHVSRNGTIDATPIELDAAKGSDYTATSFSPDGARILTACRGDKTAYVLDATTGRKLAELPGMSNATFAAFSTDGARIVTAYEDGTAEVWGSTYFSPICRAAVPGLRDGDTERGYVAGISPDGTRCAVRSNDKIAVHNLMGASSPCVLSGGDAYTQLAFSPDGRLLAEKRPAIVKADTVRVWEATDQHEVMKHAGSVSWAAFSQDGTRIVTVSGDVAIVWDATTLQELMQLTGHAKEVESAEFSPDSALIVTSSVDGTVRVWDATTGSEALRIDDPRVLYACFSPDGACIVDDKASQWSAIRGIRNERLEIGLGSGAISGSSGARIDTTSFPGIVFYWTAATGTEGGHWGMNREQHSSPDGSRIIIAARGEASIFTVGDTAGGQRGMKLVGHYASDATFSRDGARIATASSDGNAYVWDARSGLQLLRLAGHKAMVNHVVFSPDGMQLVTASRDGTARVWDTVPNRERFKERRRLEEALPEGELAADRALAGTHEWSMAAAKVRADSGVDKTVRHAALTVLTQRAVADRLAGDGK